MNLKKINPHLQQALIELGYNEANALQQSTYAAIKSGVDVVVQADPSSGKTTTLLLHVIQRLQQAVGESTRALIFVADKDQTLATVTLFKAMAKHTDLRVIGCHDKSDIDDDKNVISAGMDVIIGTPTRLNAMFSGAGFNMNTIKMFIVDDADILFRLRYDAVIQRLSMSLTKTQRLFFCEALTERVVLLAEKIMIEPLYFEMDSD